MQAQSDTRRQASSHARDWVYGLGSLIFLVGLMAWWWFYPFPSGKRPSFIDSLMFWGREAFIVMVFVAMLLAAGLVALVRSVRNLVFRLRR